MKDFLLNAPLKDGRVGMSKTITVRRSELGTLRMAAGRVLGAKFDSAFRLRMMTARAETLEQLLEEWAQERVRLGAK